MSFSGQVQEWGCIPTPPPWNPWQDPSFPMLFSLHPTAAAQLHLDQTRTQPEEQVPPQAPICPPARPGLREFEVPVLMGLTLYGHKKQWKD